jgi:hypothetical protein
LATSKYGGVYSWKSKITAHRGGVVYVYPETNSTILFYMGLDGGEPSYNMGQLYGRITIANGTGLFYNADFPGENCQFTASFIGEKLKIETFEGNDNCPFGGGVYADGEFTRTSAKVPEYFQYEDFGIHRVYFKTTKPEQFYKNF